MIRVQSHLITIAIMVATIGTTVAALHEGQAPFWLCLVVGATIGLLVFLAGMALSFMYLGIHKFVDQFFD